MSLRAGCGGGGGGGGIFPRRVHHHRYWLYRHHHGHHNRRGHTVTISIFLCHIHSPSPTAAGARDCFLNVRTRNNNHPGNSETGWAKKSETNLATSLRQSLQQIWDKACNRSETKLATNLRQSLQQIWDKACNRSETKLATDLRQSLQQIWDKAYNTVYCALGELEQKLFVLNLILQAW